MMAQDVLAAKRCRADSLPQGATNSLAINGRRLMQGGSTFQLTLHADRLTDQDHKMHELAIYIALRVDMHCSHNFVFILSTACSAN